MAKELRTLGWDYLMFVLFIAFTVFTPLWKRLFGKKKQHSKADYVFATGGVSLIAVMISISRGTLGVRTVLGKSRTNENEFLLIKVIHKMKTKIQNKQQTKRIKKIIKENDYP